MPSKSIRYPGQLPRDCECCGAPFLTWPSMIAVGRGRFCSHLCASRCQPKKAPEVRFFAKVDRSGGDNANHIWTGSKNSNGYGSFYFMGRMEQAHRVAWVLRFGPIPAGLFVLHNCPGGDAPWCVNWRHLWLGTADDNAKDKVSKGRQSRGEAHSLACRKH